MVGLWRHDCTVSRPSWALSPSLRMLQPVCMLSGRAEFLSVQDSTQAELYRIHMNAVQLSVCVIDSWIPLAFDRFSLDIIIHIARVLGQVGSLHTCFPNLFPQLTSRSCITINPLMKALTNSWKSLPRLNVLFSRLKRDYIERIIAAITKWSPAVIGSLQYV